MYTYIYTPECKGHLPQAERLPHHILSPPQLLSKSSQESMEPLRTSPDSRDVVTHTPGRLIASKVRSWQCLGRVLQARQCTASSSVGGVAHRRRVLCPITRNTPVTSLWLTGAMVELCQSTPPPSEAAQGPSQHSPTITNLWL